MRSVIYIFILFTWIYSSRRAFLPWLFLPKYRFDVWRLSRYLGQWNDLEIGNHVLRQQSRKIESWVPVGTVEPTYWLLPVFCYMKKKKIQTSKQNKKLAPILYASLLFWPLCCGLYITIESSIYPQCRRILFSLRSFLSWTSLGHSQPLPLLLLQI